eukprot:CAMPEP_0169465560 /NCGR_PEP_ID=MMETSP1042-20121227/21281_1 /TAXON_ID=464988 /ORGANISM="Hemiselmis andersenii, Strain CCMP1180" /LENGTH=185 /DNA_ID=CAMNT_0009578517 /DNA_START=1 /DNA_END=554 /DNA_ORIENTATION=+
MSLGAVGLVAFAAATVGARVSNTRAVLEQVNRERGAAAEAQGLPGMSYKGPLYDGGGKWSERGVQLTRAPYGEENLGQRKAEGSGADAQKQRQRLVAEARAAGLEVSQRPRAKISEAAGSFQEPEWMDRTARAVGDELRREVRPLSNSLATSSKIGGEISAGFSKALGVQDVAVMPKKPVKMQIS